MAWHAIGWLLTDTDEAGWYERGLEFLDERIVANRMVADWVLHALPDGEGGWIKKPHKHAVIKARFGKGSRTWQPQPAWFASAKSRFTLTDA